MNYVILEKARPHKYIKREGSKGRWIYTYLEQKKAEDEIRSALKSGNISDLKATIIYRSVGSNEALVDINGTKFLLDHSGRLHLAGIDTDYSKRKGYYPNKTQGEVNDYLKKFPKLGKKDFEMEVGIKTTEEAIEFGKTLTRKEATELWLDYKRDGKALLEFFSNKNFDPQKAADWSAKVQFKKEAVEAFLGATGPSGMTIEEIDEKLTNPRVKKFGYLVPMTSGTWRACFENARKEYWKRKELGQNVRYIVGTLEGTTEYPHKAGVKYAPKVRRENITHAWVLVDDKNIVDPTPFKPGHTGNTELEYDVPANEFWKTRKYISIKEIPETLLKEELKNFPNYSGGN